MTGDAPLDLLGGTHVVLLRPRWARNLGSVARAMKNFGLSRLTLVDSRIGSWSDAWVMAVQADSVLRAAVQSDDLDATLAGASWVVGTTNTPPAGTRVLTPREVCARGGGVRSMGSLMRMPCRIRLGLERQKNGQF
jgi:tRNA/rRNA methyltransferase